MPEPATRLVRPTAMRPPTARRSLVAPAVASLLLLALTGCGSAPQSSPERTPQKSAEESATSDQQPSAGASGVEGCPAGSPALAQARTLTRADLDGDGKPEAVRLTGPGGDCPDTLFAEVGQGLLSARLPSGTPPVARAFAARPPGLEHDLLVTRQDHPRGGFQVRLFAAGEDGLAELEADGHSLVPFVALDVDEHPLSLDCADGGVVLTEALPHRPEGTRPTWDVQRTTYAVDGTAVTAGKPEQLAESVPPAGLAQEHPALLDHAVLEGCRVGKTS